MALATMLVALSASGRPRALIVTVDARVPVRVQIALSPSHALPCDWSDNTMLFDGMVDPPAGLTLNIEEGPLCVQHAYDDFPESSAGDPQPLDPQARKNHSSCPRAVEARSGRSG